MQFRVGINLCNFLVTPVWKTKHSDMIISCCDNPSHDKHYEIYPDTIWSDQTFRISVGGDSKRHQQDVWYHRQWHWQIQPGCLPHYVSKFSPDLLDDLYVHSWRSSKWSCLSWCPKLNIIIIIYSLFSLIKTYGTSMIINLYLWFMDK